MRPKHKYGIDLLRSRFTWLSCALIIAVVFVVREIVKQGPDVTHACVKSGNDATCVTGLPGKVESVETGQYRHYDRIARDFFVLPTVPVSKQATKSAQTSESTSESDISDKNKIMQAAACMHLKAIVMGRKPRAFIDDKFLSLGEKIVVDGFSDTVFEVNTIGEDAVLLKCGAAVISLQLVPEKK